MKIFCDIVLALFFVYGVYSALWEFKLYILRKRRGKQTDEVDKAMKR